MTKSIPRKKVTILDGNVFQYFADPADRPESLMTTDAVLEEFGGFIHSEFRSGSKHVGLFPMLFAMDTPMLQAEYQALHYCTQQTEITSGVTQADLAKILLYRGAHEGLVLDFDAMPQSDIATMQKIMYGFRKRYGSSFTQAPIKVNRRRISIGVVDDHPVTLRIMQPSLENVLVHAIETLSAEAVNITGIQAHVKGLGVDLDARDRHKELLLKAKTAGYFLDNPSSVISGVESPEYFDLIGKCFVKRVAFKTCYENLELFDAMDSKGLGDAAAQIYQRRLATLGLPLGVESIDQFYKAGLRFIGEKINTFLKIKKRKEQETGETVTLSKVRHDYGFGDPQTDLNLVYAALETKAHTVDVFTSDRDVKDAVVLTALYIRNLDQMNHGSRKDLADIAQSSDDWSYLVNAERQRQALQKHFTEYMGLSRKVHYQDPNPRSDTRSLRRSGLTQETA